MATLATPGTRSSRARIVQYEIIDISISDRLSEESPIFMTRLVDETGWSMTGGAAQVGSVGTTDSIRSDTSCRACSRSVPGLKRSSMEESWAIDLDRSRVDPGYPAERVLHRYGDQGLHLGRGKPEAGRLHLHAGRGKLWEDIDRHLW